MSDPSIREHYVYLVGTHDLPLIIATATAAFVVAMLAAVVARRYLRRVLTTAHYTLRTLPQWCAWRIQVDQRGPSHRLVVIVRELIAAGVR